MLNDIVSDLEALVQERQNLHFVCHVFVAIDDVLDEMFA